MNFSSASTLLSGTAILCVIYGLFPPLVCQAAPIASSPSENPTYPRPIHPNTSIVSNHRPAATVVYPSESDEYLEMAKDIIGSIKKVTGIEISIASDKAVTEEKHPILRGEYRDQNLILLGRLGINRAIWPVYNRFLCAVDGYYPGGNGYVLRTAANVYNNGANSIVVGGSSDYGVSRAVKKLQVLIEKQTCEDGNLTLPWLLEVELGGACRNNFDQDEEREKSRPFMQDGHEGSLPKRFYESIMNYYWSGRQTYLELGLRYFDTILEYEKKSPALGDIFNHYATEFFVRAYRMIDESGLLSPAQLAAGDDLIIKLFNYYGSGFEGQYRKDAIDHFGGDLSKAAESYTAISHSNATLLADKSLADFIVDRIPDSEATSAVREQARERRDQYIRFFDKVIEERWRSCGTRGTEISSVAMGLSRYALEMERYDTFFDGGNARRAALYLLARNFARTDIGLVPPFDRDIHTEYPLFLGMVASYFGDEELKFVLDAMPRGGWSAPYGIIVNGVHAYHPGPELKASQPVSLTGARSLTLLPAHYRRLYSKAPFDVPYDESFNLATIRSGFKDDDYLFVSGGWDLPANVLARVAIGGQLWFTHPTSDASYYNQNALSIRQASQRNNLEHSAPPSVARLECLASTEDAAFIRSNLQGYAGTDWQRDILWLKGGFFIINDRVTALDKDTYSVTASWRPVGGFLEGDRWKAILQESEFVISPLITGADTVEYIEDADENAETRRSVPVYRQKATAALKRGGAIQISNLMTARPAGAGDYQFRGTPDGGFLIRATQTPQEIIYLGPLPKALGKSDSPMVVINSGKITAFCATHLVLGKQRLENDGQATTIEARAPEGKTSSVLSELWKASKGQGPADAAVRNAPITPDLLERRWQFTGARHPGLITGDKQGDLSSRDNIRTAQLISPPLSDRNVWDFGYVADLVEVRSRSRGIPGPVLISVDGTEGSFKPFEGTLSDVDVPSYSNYGSAVKKTAAFQTLRGKPQPARYAKVDADAALAAYQFLFFDAATPESPEPMRAQAAGLRKGKPADILVYPDVWPGYRDVSHSTHELFVLNSDGQVRWKKTVDGRIVFVKALDWEGQGNSDVFVGSMDNNIYVYSSDGDLKQTLTLDHGSAWQDGYTVGDGSLAYTVGLWRPDETGRRKVVLPRYHSMVSLGADGSLEGYFKRREGYFNNTILDYGVDFTGDGVEDTVVMGRDGISLLTHREVVHRADTTLDPGDPALLLPQKPTPPLAGSPTLAFHLLDGGSPLLFIARRNVVAIFDLKRKDWMFQWSPEIELTSALALPEQKQILAHSRDGFLWRIHLDEDLAVTEVESLPMTERLTKMVVLDRSVGTVAAASGNGLLRIGKDNSISLLATGSFVDVDVYPSDSDPKGIVAVNESGAVNFYDLNSDSYNQP